MISWLLNTESVCCEYIAFFSSYNEKNSQGKNLGEVEGPSPLLQKEFKHTKENTQPVLYYKLAPTNPFFIVPKWQKDNFCISLQFPVKSCKYRNQIGRLPLQQLPNRLNLIWDLKQESGLK